MYFPAVDMILEIEMGSPLAFQPIGALRNVQMQITHSEEDVSTKDDAQMRALYPEGSQTSYSFTAEFVLTDEAGFQVMKAAAQTKPPRITARLDDGNDLYAGVFQISQWQEQGGSFGAVQGSVTLQSAGAVTVSAS